jgi:transcriptional regulator with XRE-family HTH domain
MRPRYENHVRDLRQARGMNQVELARASKLSEATISKIERGEGQLTQTNAGKIALALNCAIWELFPEWVGSAECDFVVGGKSPNEHIEIIETKGDAGLSGTIKLVEAEIKDDGDYTVRIFYRPRRSDKPGTE